METVVRTGLYLRTLGSFEVTEAGRKVTLTHKKDKALLAYIAINSKESHTRERLADLLWENSSTSKGRHSLSQSVYALRRLLPNFIAVNGDSIACKRAMVVTDIDLLNGCIDSDQMAEALDYIHGPFLSDLVLPNCAEFEEWRGAFNRRFFGSLDFVVSNYLARPSSADLEKQVLKLSPLITCHMPVLSGFVDDHAIRRFPQRHTEETEPAHIPLVSESVKFAIPFVGRHEQVATLKQCLVSAKRNTSQFVLVTGFAGYGKTRLVDEFLSALGTSSNVRIVRSRCYESERRIGFGPVVDALTRSISQDEVAELPPVLQAAIAQLIPSWSCSLTTLPELDTAESQTRLFEAVYQLFSHISTKSPVIMFFDDVQWADKSTQALISYLSHRLRTSPILFLATHRTKSVHPAIEPPWCEWLELPLKELDGHSVAILVKQVAASVPTELPTVAEVNRLTGGHPYLLNEVVGCVLRGANPSFQDWEHNPIVDNVRAFATALLDDLPHVAQRVVALLAVLARPVSLRMLQTVLRTKELYSSLDILSSRGLLTEEKGQIAFRHDLIREAAYRHIPIFTRTALHRRVGNLLCRNSSRVGEAAEHFYKGQVRRLAYRYAIQAAKRADALHANEETIAFMKLAVKAHPNGAPSLRCLMAERLYRANRFTEARTEVDFLMRYTQLSTTQHLSIRLMDLELKYHSGKLNQAELTTLLGEIKRSAEGEHLIRRAVELEVRWVYHSGNRARLLECIRELREISTQVQSSASTEALVFAARLKSLVDSSIEAERWVLPVIATATALHNEERRIRVMTLAAMVLYEVGKLAYAETLHREILEHINAVGAVNAWPLAASHTHMLLVEQGKYHEADEIERSIRERADHRDAVHPYAVLCGNTAGMYYEMGEYDRAMEAVQEAAEHAKRVDATFMKVELSGLNGLIALEKGHLAEATRSAEAGREMLQQVGFRAADVSYLEILIARIDTINNHRTEAITRLREAIEDYKERDVVCRLRMQLELASLLKKAGNTEAARTQAKTVFHTATAINARPIAEKADSLLGRL